MLTLICNLQKTTQHSNSRKTKVMARLSRSSS